MNALIGLRTIIVGLLLAISPVALEFLAGVDWTTALPPGLVWASPIIMGLIQIAMRLITRTPPRFPGSA